MKMGITILSKSLKTLKRSVNTLLYIGPVTKDTLKWFGFCLEASFQPLISICTGIHLFIRLLLMLTDWKCWNVSFLAGVIWAWRMLEDIHLLTWQQLKRQGSWLRKRTKRPNVEVKIVAVLDSILKTFVSTVKLALISSVRNVAGEVNTSKTRIQNKKNVPSASAPNATPISKKQRRI